MKYIFEPPDKRAVFILVPLVILVMLQSMSDGEGRFAFWVGKVLYAGFICGGAAFLYFDLREGFSMTRPSITRDDEPFHFWTQQIVSGLFVVAGIYRLLATN